MARAEMTLLSIGLIAFVGIAVFSSHGSRPSASLKIKTPHPFSKAHPIVGLRPAHLTPLLQKEVTLLAYNPSWVQREWMASDRPPLFWSPQQNSYYFVSRFSNEGDYNVALVPPGPSYFTMPDGMSQWYGRPLRP